jgi:cleavage stimulation factor subunit 3
LTNVLQIDLWKCYITYIKESRANEENFSELVKSAYEMALEKIGIDVMSYSIWIDYINLLKSLKCDKHAIRSIYLKALRNPMMNIEQLWKDYSQFENVCA